MMRSILQSSLALLMAACAGTGGPASVHSCADAPAASAMARPFYIIGHNPNTVESARTFLAIGANALEPDLRYVDGEIRVHDQVIVLGTRIRWPLFDGPGPTLREYLRELDAQLQVPGSPQPALIAWDLKPPFELAWMREAVQTIRRDFGESHRDVAMAFTIGAPEARDEGLDVLKRLAAELVVGEGIGVDDYTSPQLAELAFRPTGKPYMFADHQKVAAVCDAIARRDRGQSFRIVYAWTVNQADDMRKFLALGVDGMIVDQAAVGTLRDLLAAPVNAGRFRLATPADRPFAAK